MDSIIANYRGLARKILEQPYHHKWSRQGLGMLRLYLSKELRLHVWHGELITPNVSMIHDHPWDFESTILAGQINNIRYVPSLEGNNYMFNRIICGEGGGLEPELPRQVVMAEQLTEHYSMGCRYAQKAKEIHKTTARNGTITIIERKFYEDTEHAHVFWDGPGWVSAEPQVANSIHVELATKAALYVMDLEDAALKK